MLGSTLKEIRMNSVRIDVGAGNSAVTFYLTDHHKESIGGAPVLVDIEDRAFRPWEVPSAGVRGLTARAIARFALQDHSRDEEVADLVRRFEAVKQPASSADAAARNASPEAAAIPSPLCTMQVSLYDYYAGHALVGLLSRLDLVRYGDTNDLIARQAGELADAMIAARPSRLGSNGPPQIPHRQ